MRNSVVLFLFILFYLSQEGSAEGGVLFSDYELIKEIDTSVSKINIYSIDYQNNKRLACIVKYDGIGRLESLIKMNQNGKTVSETVIRTYFNNTNIVVYEKTISYFSSKPSVQTIAFEYDSLFRKTTEYSFGEDTTNVSVKHYIYNNNLLFKTTTNSSTYLMYYDAQQRQIKKDCYNSKKQIIYSEVNEYSGNINNEYLINNEGKFLKSTKEYKNNMLYKKKIPEFKNNTINGTEGWVRITQLEYENTYFYDDWGRLKEISTDVIDIKNKIILEYLSKIK